MDLLFSSGSDKVTDRQGADCAQSDDSELVSVTSKCKVSFSMGNKRLYN